MIIRDEIEENNSNTFNVLRNKIKKIKKKQLNKNKQKIIFNCDFLSVAELKLIKMVWKWIFTKTKLKRMIVINLIEVNIKEKKK